MCVETLCRIYSRRICIKSCLIPSKISHALCFYCLFHFPRCNFAHSTFSVCLRRSLQKRACVGTWGQTAPQRRWAAACGRENMKATRRLSPRSASRCEHHHSKRPMVEISITSVHLDIKVRCKYYFRFIEWYQFQSLFLSLVSDLSSRLFFFFFKRGYRGGIFHQPSSIKRMNDSPAHSARN